MGLFDKLKQQGMNALQQGANALNNMTGNQQPSGGSEPTESIEPEKKSEGIYGDYIEHLIDMALADGELTEKEKQVLFKKAEAAGIDLDEFEMVLDARLFEKQKAMKAPQPQAIGGAAPKSDKYGDVKKCPSCGAMIESFTTRCPDCGYEFRNIEAASSITALSKKLEQLDSQKGGGFFSAFKDESIDKKKADAIRTFPVPNTKEDLLEFLSYAVSLGKKKGGFFSNEAPSERIMREAWFEKCKQIIMKARFSMKDDPKTLAEIESYAKELKIK